MPIANWTPKDDSNGQAKASIEAIPGNKICAIINEKGDGKICFYVETVANKTKCGRTTMRERDSETHRRIYNSKR